MNPSPPELFPQRPIRSDFGRAPSYRTRRIITILVILLLAGGLFRWVVGGPSLSHPGEIPTIRAEGAWKQRPEQPGGIDIPHQDVQVYQALDSKDAAKPQVEHLLPPPEVPQAMAETPGSVNNPANNVATTVGSTAPSPLPQTESLMPAPIATTVTPVTAAVAPSPPSPPPSPVTALPAPAPMPVPAAAPSVPTTVESQSAQTATPSAAAPPVKKKPLTTAQAAKDLASAGKADRIVQLASVQGETDAQNMMDRLQTHYASILGDAELRIVRADLGAKGIYYRIQSQPMPDSRANQICTEVKKLKAGCILVR